MIQPPWPFVEQDFLRLLEAIEENPNGFLRVSDKGFVAGCIEENPASRGWFIAKEIFWFGDADLIRTFRKWALKRGANEIHYSCPPSNKVGGFYAGFSRPVDVVFSEVV